MHYAPHGAIDVQDWDCDYLVCSGYKIFAPHMGFLWGKRHLLEALPTFREDFIPDQIPSKIEVGTFVYENVAGMDAAIRYLEQLGQQATGNNHASLRRDSLVSAMDAIRNYEMVMSAEILSRLGDIDGVTVYGVRDQSQLHRRLPTICFTMHKKAADEVASYCAAHGVGVRDGNMYSPRLLARLGISPQAGALRASLVHYNTLQEIDVFTGLVRRLAEG